MPPRVLASGPKPCGGNKYIVNLGTCGCIVNNPLSASPGIRYMDIFEFITCLK